jgi:hypothetical protein
MGRRGESVGRQLIAAFTVLVGACGGAPITAAPITAGPATPAAATGGPSSPPVATPAPTSPASLPDTPLRASLDQTYASAGLVFDEAKMGGLGPGDLVAQWYQEGGWFIVAYVGWDLGVTGPLCPGNSIQVDGGFRFVSNSPTAAGACTNLSTVQPAPVGPLICGDLVLYRTAIPAVTRGILWASINSQLDGGAYVGLAGTVDGRTTGAPPIDLEPIGCRPAI